MSDTIQLTQSSEHKRDDILFSAATAQPGDRLFVGSSDFGIHELTAAADGGSRFADAHQSYVTGLTLAGSALISGSYDRTLVWWDLDSRQPIRQLTAHDRWIRRVITTPDQSRIVTVADDMLCKLWDSETAELITAFADHAPLTKQHYPSMLYAVAVSPDGRLLATGDKTGHVVIRELEGLTQVGELQASTMYTWDPVQRRHSIGGIRSLAFSPDGQQLAVGGIGAIGNIDHLGGPARLEVFDWAAAKHTFIAEDDQRKGLIEQIRWDPAGHWILTAGGDHKGFVSLYNADTGQLITQAEARGHIHDLVLNQQTGDLTTVGHQHVTRWTMTAAAAPAETAEPVETAEAG